MKLRDIRIFIAIIYMFFAIWQQNPAQAIILLVTSTIVAYVIIYNISINSNYDKERRLNALHDVKIYLAPYKNIWKDLKLKNKYCILNLNSDGITISGKEK